MKPLQTLLARRGSVGFGLLATLLVAGCVRAPVRIERTKPASFGSAVRAALSTAEPQAATPRLVLFTDAHAVGIDAATGDEVWRRPVRAFGPPATSGDTVVVPVYGHRAIALDADTGATRWQTKLPGQILTGLDATSRFVIVTALMSDPEPRRRPRKADTARSVVASLAMGDGRVRWVRPSATLLGVPAASGPNGFVPTGGDVLAVRLRSGRALGRFGGEAQTGFHRVERHGSALLAADGASLVDLGVGTRYSYEQDGARLFEGVEGIEPGLGHDDGIVFRLLPPPGAGAPRNALFLGRRALVFVRLDERGRAQAARWVHLRYDQHEYVDLHATRSSVLLVRDDGAIVELDRQTGRVRRERPGQVTPVGAAFVGQTAGVDDTDVGVDRETVVGNLVGLVEDPDPRLLPAQRLALKLLWRDPFPAARRQVADVALAVSRVDDSASTLELRTLAETLTHSVWGPGDEESTRALLLVLQPGRTRGDTLREACREAVRSGSPEVITALVHMLEDPVATPRELDHITRALRDLDAAGSVEGIARFVALYHADPDIVDASKAIYYAAELLVAHAQPDLPAYTTAEATEIAQATLRRVVGDEFTVPALRQFIESRLQPEPAAAQPALDGPTD